MLHQNKISEINHPNLIIYLGYGDELEVYPRCKAFWDFYLSHFKSINAFFVRDSKKFELGEVICDGKNVIIGIGSDNKNEVNGYAETGIWSPNENYRAIRKQLALYEFLLKRYDKHFFLYHSTITSIVDFRGLIAILDELPQTNCFAGSLSQITSPKELAGLNFVSGANTLLSRDLLLVLLNRFDPLSTHSRLPNDVWQSLALHDVNRLAIPFFSFTKERYPRSNLNDISNLTRLLLEDGHFHFRIKTRSEDAMMSLREDVDPWIMLKIIETILSFSGAPKKNIDLRINVQNFALEGQDYVPPFSNFPINTGPRSFALFEDEAPILYRYFPDES